MKPDIRVVGFDDAPFSWDDERVPVVGAVVRGLGYVESFLRTDVAVDGDDAAARLADAVAACRQRPSLKAVLVDGAALGGFNVVDVPALHRATGLPVLTVTKGEPGWDAMREALQMHHEDWERRWRLLAEVRPEPIDADRRLWVRWEGCTREEAGEILARTTVRGHVPEALRLADMAARLLRPG